MSIGFQEAITILIAAILVTWAIRALARILQLLVTAAALFAVVAVLRHPGSAPDAILSQVRELAPLIAVLWDRASETIRLWR